MVINSSIGIFGTVGKRGRNNKLDVMAVQERLNELMGTSRIQLDVDGKSGPITEGMIADFQLSVVKFNRADSRVDPAGKTITALNDPASAAIWRATIPKKPAASKNRNINLHFRSISLTNVSFQSQFDGAKAVYGQNNIKLHFRSGSSIKLSKVDRNKFSRVNSTCLAGKDEWSALQKLLNDVPNTDICVVFVGQLWDPKEKPGQRMFLGCGAYRPGSPACAIAANASKYDMAHEIGHVLGLDHDNTSGNLMHPTQSTYPKAPKLTSGQLSKIKKSRLCR